MLTIDARDTRAPDASTMRTVRSMIGSAFGGANSFSATARSATVWKRTARSFSSARVTARSTPQGSPRLAWRSGVNGSRTIASTSSGIVSALKGAKPASSS